MTFQLRTKDTDGIYSHCLSIENDIVAIRPCTADPLYALWFQTGDPSRLLQCDRSKKGSHNCVVLAPPNPRSEVWTPAVHHDESACLKQGIQESKKYLVTPPPLGEPNGNPMCLASSCPTCATHDLIWISCKEEGRCEGATQVHNGGVGWRR